MYHEFCQTHIFILQLIEKASLLRDVTVEKQNRDSWSEEEMNIVRDLSLRYFTPREIANILCFPPEFGK